MLEVKGYRVLEASDGRQAIEAALSEKPDLVLMDLNLPRCDGFVTTRRLREQSELREVPIVAVTAHGTSEYRSRAIAAGCDEFITKPINFTLLEKILSDLLLVKRS
jgi:CheY-like chemotaxis protein